MTIRVIDAGNLSPARSQAIYHGVAHAWTDSTPDTILLVTPDRPYFCIGYHQDLDRELDADFCARHGIPVVRRELGGGAVYLDRNQLFVQWVMARDLLPAAIEESFRRFAAPLIATY